MAILVFFTAHLYLSAFCQSFFLHRYASHRMYLMPVFWERFFYGLTFLTQGLFDMNPKSYALMHERHHAHTDTAQDPHSPIVLKNPVRLFFHTIRIFKALNQGAFPADSRAGGGYPQWPAFDRTIGNAAGRTLICAGITWFYVAFAENHWWYALLPIQLLMGPLEGLTVNWIGHRYGYQNFKLSNSSKIALAVDLIGLGELLHNNHHADPARPNFARRWFEFDPVYAFSRLFELLGILRFRSRIQEAAWR